MMSLYSLSDSIKLTQQEVIAFDAIMASDLQDVVGLIASCRYDVRKFFEHGDCAGLDFRGSNIRGISFKGADLTDAIFRQDQAEEVRKTNAAQGARFIAQSAGGPSEFPSTPAPREADHGPSAGESTALAAFRAEVARMLDEKRRVDWARLVPLAAALQRRTERLIALQLLLESTPSLPSKSLLDVFAAPHDEHDTVQGPGPDIALARAVVGVCNAESIVEAFEQIDEAGASINGDPRLQQLLGNLVQDEAHLHTIIEELRERGATASATLLSVPLRRAPSFASARALFDAFRDAGGSPVAAHFTTLMEKSQTPEERRAVLALVRETSVTPDRALFERLAQKADTPEERRAVFARMGEAGISPDRALFQTLAQKAETPEERRTVLARMSEAGIALDQAVLQTLAEKAETLEESRAVLALMRESGVSVTRHIASALLGVCSTLAEAQEFFDLLENVGGKASLIDLNRLLNNARDAIESENVYNLIVELGLKPDRYSFGALLKKQSDYESAKLVLQKRRPAGFKLSLQQFHILLWKARSWNEVSEVLEEISRAKLVPDGFSIEALLHAPLSEVELRTGLLRMIAGGLDLATVEVTSLGDRAAVFEKLKTELKSR